MPKEQDQLVLRYVPLDQVAMWDDNPKRHDIGGIIQSIQIHGFKDPLKFEVELNDRAGGIVEGNGRTVALLEMRRVGMDSPRGILVEGGQWMVPVVFGVDSATQALAKSYGWDHNSLTMMAGDFTAFDALRMYDDTATDFLLQLGEHDALPITAGGDVLQRLLEPPPQPGDQAPEPTADVPRCPTCGQPWSGGE